MNLVDTESLIVLRTLVQKRIGMDYPDPYMHANKLLEAMILGQTAEEPKRAKALKKLLEKN